MRLVGIVRWKAADKDGNPIAGVEPLYEIDDDDEWRPVAAAEDFPTQGQVFWPSAREATEHAFLFFRAEDNRRQKDRYRVADPRPALEIVDLRDIGPPAAVKSALALGIRRHELREGLALVRCAPEVLVGPVKLVKRPNGLVTFEASNPDRIPCFAAGVDGEVRSLHDGHVERTILLRPVGAMSVGAPTGYVDWDDDRLIVRRALTAAVARAKRSGADPGLTKRMIDEAADAVMGDRGGAELELERYRLERARELCSNADHIGRLAAEIAEELLKHPSILASLDDLRARVRAELEEEVRSEIETSFAASRGELAELNTQISDARAALAQTREGLAGAQRQLTEARTLAASQAAELDAEIARRLSELMERPSTVLADVAILRGFLGSGPARGFAPRAVDADAREIAWSAAASTVNERVALQRALFAAFKALGVPPALALRLHAAVVAGVMPVVSGSGGLAALRAYGHVVCGGRVAVLHIAPDQLRPLSLDGGELARAVAASRSVSAPSLVVFEGANRGPTEAYLTPLLEVVEAIPTEGGPACVTSVAPAGLPPPPGLRWAATAVSGAATVPLSRELWAHAVSVHVLATRRGSLPSSPPTDVALSSDLMLPGDPPDEMIEEILETWPLAKENEPCLRAFAAALARFEGDQQKIKRALVECSLLPLVTSFQDDELREDALERLQALVGGAPEGAQPLADLERRLRWRLA